MITCYIYTVCSIYTVYILLAMLCDVMLMSMCYIPVIPVNTHFFLLPICVARFDTALEFRD